MISTPKPCPYRDDPGGCIANSRASMQYTPNITVDAWRTNPHVNCKLRVQRERELADARQRAAPPGKNPPCRICYKPLGNTGGKKAKKPTGLCRECYDDNFKEKTYRTDQGASTGPWGKINYGAATR